MLTFDQIERLKSEHNISDGEEWIPSAGTGVAESELHSFLYSAPFCTASQRRKNSPVVAVPDPFPKPDGHQMSTQEAFGRVLASIARQDTELAQRIITVSPDVTVSTNLSGWVNQRGLFHVNGQTDMFTVEELQTMHRWRASPTGQHIELGIAENNLFLLLAAAGLSHSIFGERPFTRGNDLRSVYRKGPGCIELCLLSGCTFFCWSLHLQVFHWRQKAVPISLLGRL